MRRIVLALLFVALLAPAALADTVYLRNGTTVRGTVLGFIGGRFAVRVESTTGRPEEGEVRFFRPRDIERVEIDGRSLDDARFSSRTVRVELGPNWVDSGVDLRRNERVSVKADGTILAGRSRITPAGLRSTDPNAPLPRAAEGVLIGAISNDPNAPVIEIGLSRDFVADRDGRLYLTVNRGTYTDARGAFNVQVRTERDFARRGGDRRDRPGTPQDDEDSDIFDDRTSTDPAPTRPRSPGGGDPLGGRPADPGPRTPREVTVNVPGNSTGTDTGVDLRAGDQVTINATGTIVAGQRVGEVGPDGRRGGFFGNPRYPFPQAGAGALLGYIRDTSGQQSQIFLVGPQLIFTPQVDGRLFLLINDDNYSDNGGQFTVRIRY